MAKELRYFTSRGCFRVFPKSIQFYRQIIVYTSRTTDSQRAYSLPHPYKGGEAKYSRGQVRTINRWFYPYTLSFLSVNSYMHLLSLYPVLPASECRTSRIFTHTSTSWRRKEKIQKLIVIQWIEEELQFSHKKPYNI